MGTGRSQRGYPEAAPASSAVEAASAPPWSHHLPSIGPSSRSQQHPRDACTRALLYRTYGGLHRLLARRARVTKSSRCVLSHATGFVMKIAKGYGLITNLHVVTGINPTNGRVLSN